MGFRFLTTCVTAPGPTPGEDITAMVEAGREITRRTFLRWVDREDLTLWETALGYDRDFPMSRDWHVRYARSTYRGVPCVYFDHSRIEHVFTRP